MTAEDRVEHLRKMIEVAKKREPPITFPLRWKGQDIPLHIIRTDVRFLRYNLESGRTHRMQLEYLASHPDDPKDLFDDPESKAAQDAQETILLGMVKQEGLEKDLLDEGQREPAIITYDGFVVNGNRRLAAMRKNDIQHMNCVVLPEDATPKDLYRLELDLQMAADTRMDYTWVDELLHIRYGISKVRERKEDVAKAMRIDPKELERKERMLGYVDWYLEWSKAPGQYQRVPEKSEQAFKQIEKHASKMKDPERRKCYCYQAFGIVKNPPDETRLYEHLNALAKNFDVVQQKLTKEESPSGELPREKSKQASPPNLKPLAGSDPGKGETETGSDPLDALANGSNGQNSSNDAVSVGLSLFADHLLAKESTPRLIDAIQDAKVESKENKDRNEALRLVCLAHEKMREIEIDSNTAGIDEIQKMLTKIEMLSQRLLKQLEKTRQP